jgi:hypothetical protein
MIIAIDFDGTCVTHDYPLVGKDIGSVPVLKQLVESGHKIMLWTMRGSKPDGHTLADAVNWFELNGTELWGINENPEQTNVGRTNSNKQYAQLYIDDAALGCSLIYDESISGRPFVDWNRVEMWLIDNCIINSKKGKIN